MHRKDVNVYTVCKINVKLKDIEFAKFVSPVRHDQQNLTSKIWADFAKD